LWLALFIRSPRIGTAVDDSFGLADHLQDARAPAVTESPQRRVFQDLGGIGGRPWTDRKSSEMRGIRPSLRDDHLGVIITT